MRMMQCFFLEKKIPSISNLIKISMERKKNNYEAEAEAEAFQDAQLEGDRERPAGELYKGAKTIVVSASEARLITPDQVTKSEERGRQKEGKLGKENEWRTRRNHH